MPMSYVEAFPFVDWNEKVYVECYSPFLKMGLFEKISFDFGPTLVRFLALRHPHYLKNLKNHKNAVFHPFYHVIYPLAGSLEKRINTYWGIRFHQEFFGKEPKGAWLPEAAVDSASLKVLLDFGIKFVVLGSHQLRPLEGSPYAPGVIELGSGEFIAVFPFHRERSNELSFGELLSSGEVFVKELCRWFSQRTSDYSDFVLLATDGETFGHHRKGTVEVLSDALSRFSGAGKCRGITLISDLNEVYEKNFPGIFGSRFGLKENTSWSCEHGIERWRRDCGCSSGANPDWNQEWRAPLREAMDFLGKALEGLYFEAGEKIFRDPLDSLYDYWEILYLPVEYALSVGKVFPHDVEGYFEFSRNRRIRYLKEKVKSSLSSDMTVLKFASLLLESMTLRFAMMTSCGWFFDDVKGYEATQNIRLSKGALRFMREAFAIAGRSMGKEYEDYSRRVDSIESTYLRILGGARSNIGGDAREVYRAVLDGEEKRAIPEIFFLKGLNCLDRLG